MFDIRPAWVTDAPHLARVHIQAWRDAYNGLMPDSFLASLDADKREMQWRKNLADPAQGVATWCAFVDGELAGFAVSGPSRGDMLGTPGEIYAINVPKSRWRRGIGRALIASAADSLLAQGLRDAALWVVEGNANARAFYRHLGGVETGVCEARDFGGTLLREIAVRWNDIGLLAHRVEAD